MKPDPTLTRANVSINYTASDGYKSTFGAACPTMNSPKQALISGLDELARIVALFGYEEDARATFDAALKRVADWRAARATGAAQ